MANEYDVQVQLFAGTTVEADTLDKALDKAKDRDYEHAEPVEIRVIDEVTGEDKSWVR